MPITKESFKKQAHKSYPHLPNFVYAMKKHYVDPYCILKMDVLDSEESLISLSPFEHRDIMGTKSIPKYISPNIGSPMGWTLSPDRGIFDNICVFKIEKEE